MLIGILQCGHFPDVAGQPPVTYTDLYTDLLDGHGLTFRTWSVVDMEFPGSVHDADGWLLSGSKHGAYENHPFIPPLEKLIRDIYAANVPLVGICFGHQITAQALGGKVEKYAGGWNCGPRVYDTDGAPMTLTAWHQDQVIEAPTEAGEIWSSQTCEVSLIRYRGKALTMQPHPEFDDSSVQKIMNGPASEYLSAELLDEVRKGLGTPLDNSEAGNRIARFFKDNK